MPRKPRNFDPNGGTYHVTVRGNNKRRVFFNEMDYYCYLAIIRRCKRLFPFELHHYCLMSNHVHLCITTNERYPLSKVMKYINERYANAFNQRHVEIGHLWQARYYKVDIKNDKHLAAEAFYIELNPWEAGMVGDPAEYRWSSYRHYAFGEKNDLIDDDPLYAGLGRNGAERRREYVFQTHSRMAEIDRISPIEAPKEKVVV